MASRGLWPEGAVAVPLAGYLAGRLTGTVAADTTHAASWGLLDLEAGAWDGEICAALGVGGLLPEVRPSAAPLAPLLPQAAAALGLAAPGEVTVHAPVGDNQASYLGAAGAGPEAAVVNLGTGGQVSWPLPDGAPAVADGDIETRPLPGGGRLAVAASLCGGWSWQYLAQLFRGIVQECVGRELPMAEVYNVLNRLSARAGDDAGGLRWSTQFLGTRADGSLRGGLADVDAANLAPAPLARAMADGIAGELAGLWKRGGGPAGGTARRLVACGNGARRNPALVDALSRVFGMPCVLGPHLEEAAVGAALAVAP